VTRTGATEPNPDSRRRPFGRYGILDDKEIADIVNTAAA